MSDRWVHRAGARIRPGEYVVSYLETRGVPGGDGPVKRLPTSPAVDNFERVDCVARNSNAIPAQSTWDTIQEEIRVQREAITRILSGKPRPLSIPSRNGWTLLVHPDTYPGREGKWRITRFEGQEPVGHVECENFAGAVNEAHWLGGQLERATDA